MELHVYSSIEEVQEAAAEQLQYALDTEEHILLLTTGGSVLSLLEQVDTEVLDAHITIGILNEVHSAELEDRTMESVKRLPIMEAWMHRGVRTINMSIKEGESLNAYALRIDTLVSNWIENNPDAYVLATMGVGSDGHVAGILPYVEHEHEDALEELFTGKRWFVGYSSESDARLTATVTFLEQLIDETIVYAVGSAKKEALERLLADEEDIHQLPCTVLHSMNSVEIYTDQDIEVEEVE